MAATTLKLTSFPVPVAPRGAGWAATAFAAVLEAGASLVDRYTAQRRRAAELRAMQEMFRLADSYAGSQPGFASDLRAAATRVSEGY